MPKKVFAPMVPWSYDLILWLMSVLVDLFFREVHPRGAYRIPRRGPVIFVAAPHANQFVDPLVLMRAVRLEARRRIAFLVAEKSMRRPFIGFLSRMAGAVPVSRAQDLTKPGVGRVYMPDPEDPLRIHGIGTKFTKDAMVGSLLALPSTPGQSGASSDIAEIVSDTEVVLKRELKGAVALKQLTAEGEGGKGTKYKLAPKVDQTQVYEAVFHRLNSGGCVGIFPEGGSHDRTELLPLKAGVAIMALGALAEQPDSDLNIVPVGMNYFHAHKFRSRAVVEFGTPIEVPKELVDMYRGGEKRESVKTLLEIVYNGLVAVTVTSPDYDTLMVIQAVRRLYKPTHKKLPLPAVVELNRRLVTGYARYKDDPRIINLRNSVVDYNRQLRLLGIRDHQVEYAKFSIPAVIFTFLYRLAKLILLSLGALPGFILFLPVFIATKRISRRKATEALKASTVKIQARDVMATWKLLVSLALAPVLYNVYVLLFCWWRSRQHYYLLPASFPTFGVFLIGWILFPTITYAALRFGEIGMDIFKSLRPLITTLNPSTANTLVKLRAKRAQLSTEVTDVINSLGPEIFPDFDSSRIVADPFRDSTPTTPEIAIISDSPHRRPSIIRDHDQQVPSNEEFNNLGNIGIFASRPSSRGRSRTNSGGFGLTPLSGMTQMGDLTSAGKMGFEEVSRKISESMKERRRRKSRQEMVMRPEEEVVSDSEEEEVVGGIKRE